MSGWFTRKEEQTPAPVTALLGAIRPGYCTVIEVPEAGANDLNVFSKRIEKAIKGLYSVRTAIILTNKRDTIEVVGGEQNDKNINKIV